LRAQIRKGLDSGEAKPLNVGDIKAQGRRRLAAEQPSRERPVSGHGQGRESVENGGGRPARYALTLRGVVIFLIWAGLALDGLGKLEVKILN